ncbi:Sir2 family NAD-dependent protein deacetylase, partial [uncultured Campylobacter sp.]|uniref:SIR2 family NAD-dependent protein deacylase n=1 Tax=uncultured Campylobacter sp. TaxID=218934 RepID=UPI00261C2628
DKDLGFTDMANPQWFFDDPKLAWAFYGHRLKLYNKTEPHAGFAMLRELCAQKNDNYFICTSNVDGHFVKACFDRDKIYEIHGSIHHSQCIHNDDGNIWNMDENSVEVDEEKFIATKMPVCPECGCVSRPNILMFYDHEFNHKRAWAQRKKYDAWLSHNMNSRIVIIEIGAGLAVPTIRIFGERMAKRFKMAHLIRINPVDTHVSAYRGMAIKAGGLEGLRMLLG